MEKRSKNLNRAKELKERKAKKAREKKTEGEIACKICDETKGEKNNKNVK